MVRVFTNILTWKPLAASLYKFSRKIKVRFLCLAPVKDIYVYKYHIRHMKVVPYSVPNPCTKEGEIS